MRILTTLFLLPSLGVAQVPVLMPRIGNTPDLSPERFAFFAWYNAAMRSDLELTAADQARFDSVYLSMGESFESPCEIIGIGCSWYCGGGPDSVRASSTLAPVGEHGYDALQAQDLDYCTAWCEGVQGPGIGESLTYHFAKDSPRLHTVMIANGLVTSDEAWRANNRVRILRVAENGVPVVDLHLEDTMDDQTFKLPRLMGKRVDGAPMILTFTILEVYRGARRNDTVITEIWFDGIDVH